VQSLVEDEAVARVVNRPNRRFGQFGDHRVRPALLHDSVLKLLRDNYRSTILKQFDVDQTTSTVRE
jgi:hypothetical protein